MTVFHGSVRSHSRYVRMTPYSAAAGGSLSSRESSRLAAVSACSGRFASSILVAELRQLGLLRIGLAQLLLDRP